MLRTTIICLLIAVTNACSFDKESADVNDRCVRYKVATIMPNIELVVNYYVENNVSKSVIVDKFPWEIEAYISPYNKIGMSGYMRYKDKNMQIHNYIDMKLMIDVGNSYLNKGDTIFIESVEAGVTDEDLKKNTKFDLQLDPL